MNTSRGLEQTVENVDHQLRVESRDRVGFPSSSVDEHRPVVISLAIT